MDTNFSLYCLFSTRAPTQVKYIGKTGIGVAKRFWGHKSQAFKQRRTTALCEWMRAERSAGFEVFVREIVCGLTEFDAFELEHELLSLFTDGLLNSHRYSGAYSERQLIQRREFERRKVGHIHPA